MSGVFSRRPLLFTAPFSRAVAPTPPPKTRRHPPRLPPLCRCWRVCRCGWVGGSSLCTRPPRTLSSLSSLPLHSSPPPPADCHQWTHPHRKSTTTHTSSTHTQCTSGVCCSFFCGVAAASASLCLAPLLVSRPPPVVQSTSTAPVAVSRQSYAPPPQRHCLWAFTGGCWAGTRCHEAGGLLLGDVNRTLRVPAAAPRRRICWPVPPEPAVLLHPCFSGRLLDPVLSLLSAIFLCCQRASGEGATTHVRRPHSADAAVPFPPQSMQTVA